MAANNDRSAPNPIEQPKNVAYKYVDTNSNKTITIEPDEPVVIILNLYKNIIATVE
jgi:hypothetical protein